MRVPLRSILAAVILLTATPAAAQYATITDNEKLKAARLALEGEKFADAAAATIAALEIPGNAIDEMIEITAIRAISEALAGKKAAAVESFKRLLAIDFDHKLPPGMKPAVTAALAAAREWWKGKPSGIVVGHDGVPPPYAGSPIRVSASVLDPLELVKKTILYYRNDAAKSFSHVEGERRPGASRVELFIPGSDVGSGLEIEYYLELTDEHGGVVARLGEARSPRSTIVPGLPPGFARPPPSDKRKVPPGAGRAGGRLPAWALGAAGGAAALVLAGIIFAVVPKTVDLSVVTCVGSCEK